MSKDDCEHGDFPEECGFCEADRLRAENAKLQAFKAYVHQRLDAAGVPADPEPEKNAEHGCRIEGRLNWLLDLLGPSVSHAAQVSKVAALITDRAKLQAEHDQIFALLPATTNGDSDNVGGVRALRDALELVHYDRGCRVHGGDHVLKAVAALVRR